MEGSRFLTLRILFGGIEMKSQIIIREAVTEEEIAEFWQQLYTYFDRDIFPNPQDEDREYFFGPEYRQMIEKLHSRKENPIH